MPPAKRKRGKRPSSTDPSWVYGLHAVAAALANPQRRCRRLVATDEAAAARDPAAEPRPEVWPRAEIDRLLPPGAVHQGLAGLFSPLPAAALDDLLDRPGDDRPCAVLVLDQVTDPRNVGAILRSAAAFDCRGVVVQDRHSPPLSGVLFKAASGGAETVPLIRVANLARAIDDLKGAGFWSIGFDADGPEVLSEVDLGGRVALVLGAEGQGLRRLTRDRCDRLVRIPIGGGVASLNVAAAAAIALYEWARPK
jgi:23S rRNA (guanosine2251-2'-O)-methyltransferase